jgi:putative oxidoreductase
MSDFFALIGRILLSVLFVWGGWGKLTAASATMALIAKSGLPVPEVAYAVAVFIELGVGLALLVGLFTRLSGLVLAAWCIITAVQFHSNFADLNMEIHFLKNVGIAGGMLYAVGFGGGAFSLDAVIARRRAAAV